jgi:hypothetical protein
MSLPYAIPDSAQQAPADRPTADALQEIAARLIQSAMPGVAERTIRLIADTGVDGERAAERAATIAAGRAADATMPQFERYREDVLVPSAIRRGDHAPRFFLAIPRDAIGQAELFEAAIAEIDGTGVDAELRNFLDAILEPGDAFIDADPGFGFSMLTASSATTGTVSVVTRSADQDHATFLLHNAEVNRVGAQCTVIPPERGVPATLDAMSSHPAIGSAARWIAYLGQASDLQTVLAGGRQTMRDPRLGAVAWTTAGDRASAVAQSSLDAMGFEHFAIARDADGPVLVPAARARGFTLMVSIPTARTAGDRVR